jgi:hypothetical protein
MTHQKSREPEVSLDVIRDDIFKVLIGKKTKPTKTLSTKTFISNKTILQNEGKTETFPEKQRLRTAVAHICCLLYKILDQFRLKKYYTSNPHEETKQTDNYKDKYKSLY